MSKNRTWTFGNWRLYVVKDDANTIRWTWNLRDTVWGWEIGGKASKRSDALSEALDQIQAIDLKAPEAYRDYEFLVMGENITISALPSEDLSNVMRLALEKSHNTRQQFGRWEVRTEEGDLCELVYPVQVFFTNNRIPLGVTLKPGVGG